MHNTRAIAGFDLSDMVTYILIHQFVFEFTWSYPGKWQVKPDIVYGGLTDYLLRPENYLLSRLFRSTGTMFPRWTSTLIIFLILFAIFVEDIELSSSFWIYPAGLLAIALCYLLIYFYSFLLGLAAFWTESDLVFMNQLHYFFSGMIVPVAFLPAGLRKVSEYLPFQYTLYFPTLVLMDKVAPQEFLFATGIQAIWIVFFAGAIRVVWMRGIRRYGAYGG